MYVWYHASLYCHDALNKLYISYQIQNNNVTCIDDFDNQTVILQIQFITEQLDFNTQYLST